MTEIKTMTAKEIFDAYVAERIAHKSEKVKIKYGQMGGFRRAHRLPYMTEEDFMAALKAYTPPPCCPCCGKEADSSTWLELVPPIISPLSLTSSSTGTWLEL